jgi:hypothetical protein
LKVVAIYSFNDGERFINKNHKSELKEVIDIIRMVDSESCRTKKSKEKTMKGKILYSPVDLNACFKNAFENKGWKTGYRIQVKTEIPETDDIHKGFREMDAIKNKLGAEVQFGKYSFMVYNVAAKMTIFANRGIIDSGIEIVPMLSLANEMSSGVSYFEQMKTDLEMRGVSNIDIPVLIIGITQNEGPLKKIMKVKETKQLYLYKKK